MHPGRATDLVAARRARGSLTATASPVVIELVGRRHHGQRSPSRRRPRPTPSPARSTGAVNGRAAWDELRRIADQIDHNAQDQFLSSPDLRETLTDAAVLNEGAFGKLTGALTGENERADELARAGMAPFKAVVKLPTGTENLDP